MSDFASMGGNRTGLLDVSSGVVDSARDLFLRSAFFRAGLAALGVFLGLTAASATPALAQDEGGEDGVIYKQRTVYSFEGDTIDGDLMRPDGAYIEARKELQHSNLIQVRDNFREKVLESVVFL